MSQDGGKRGNDFRGRPRGGFRGNSRGSGGGYDVVHGGDQFPGDNGGNVAGNGFGGGRGRGRGRGRGGGRGGFGDVGGYNTPPQGQSNQPNHPASSAGGTATGISTQTSNTGGNRLNTCAATAHGPGQAPQFENFGRRQPAPQPYPSQNNRGGYTGGARGENLDHYRYAEHLQPTSTDIDKAAKLIDEHAAELVRNPPKAKPEKKSKPTATKTSVQTQAQPSGAGSGGTTTAQTGVSTPAQTIGPINTAVQTTTNLPSVPTGNATSVQQGRLQTQQTQLAVQISPSQIELAKSNHGLRTSFGIEGDDVQIATNYLKTELPEHIYAYTVDMIRGYDQQNQPILVGKKSDKMLVMAKLQVDVQELRNPSTWVHDGSNIWSTKPLFPGNVGAAPVYGQPLQYTNEMGVQLTLQLVQITHTHYIPLTESAVRHSYDGSQTPVVDSIPSVLARGLNAFFTNYTSRSNAQVITTGANRSFEKVQGQVLGRFNGHVRALTGFSLSTRPGNNDIFVNVNTAISPFFAAGMTVADFIYRADASGKQRQIFGLLKGVKVQINYRMLRSRQNPVRNNFGSLQGCKMEVLVRAG